MQQTDESAAEKKIEAGERNQRSRIVKHATGRILQQAALLEKAVENYQKAADTLLNEPMERR